MPIDLLEPIAHIHTALNAKQLDELFKRGVVDPASYESYQTPARQFVEIIVRDKDGNIKDARANHNLRNNPGGDWQALIMGGDVNNSYQGTATASTATSLTGTGTPWVANQWTHHAVYTGPNGAGAGSSVFGQILSNTTSALTVDRWYTPGNTIGGAAGTTPNATCQFIIGPGLPLRFIALSADAVAPATTDTSLAAEITTNGLGRAEGTFAHTTVSGGTTTTVTSTYTLAKTFTATGTQNSIQKCALFYSVVASTGTAFFENTFASVNVISGDTLAVTWTINM